MEAVLLDFNRSEEDIIFRQEFQGMPAAHAGVEVHFALTNLGPGWGGMVGRIRAEVLEQALQAFAPEVV